MDEAVIVTDMARVVAATVLHGHEHKGADMNRRLAVAGHNVRKLLRSVKDRKIFLGFMLVHGNPSADYLDFDVLAVFALEMSARLKHLPGMSAALRAESQRFADQFRRRACFECGASSTPMKTCSGCGIVSYCSRKCQKQNWKTQHKAECVVFKRDEISIRPPLFASMPF